MAAWWRQGAAGGAGRFPAAYQMPTESRSGGGTRPESPAGGGRSGDAPWGGGALPVTVPAGALGIKRRPQPVEVGALGRFFVFAAGLVTPVLPLRIFSNLLR